ncbi:MAG: 2-C-methyl-D-erythritol 4-phosphate cytidylyltransferase [Deltaproteobacteria bacterium]|nr:2-C-methyl-D-erythritol 4-phosphate cytidylyltransferase [Deltaproteobacteria bacterium]
MHCSGLIVAAGKGQRMGGPLPKQFLTLGDRPVLAWTLQAFEACDAVHSVVLVVAPGSEEEVRELLRPFGLTKLVAVRAGGAERADSVRQGLDALPQSATHVAIHDAARPLVRPEQIARAVSAAVETGAALLALPVRDTVKRGEGGLVAETLDRRTLFLAQTPQVFALPLLRRAYATWNGDPVTDDVQLVERLGHPVRLVEGDPSNLKITVPEDLPLARAFLPESAMKERWPRVGVGYDVHQLVPGGPLILGGVEIPFSHHLLGHSDADVICHAAGDALLGAAALGDLGKFFPPGDPRYKGASSLDLLAEIRARVAEQGYRVGNLDTMVICERPKLSPFVPTMRERIARVLEVEPEVVSVKATTNEGLGFTGRGEGIAAHATALLVPR